MTFEERMEGLVFHTSDARPVMVDLARAVDELKAGEKMDTKKINILEAKLDVLRAERDAYRDKCGDADRWQRAFTAMSAERDKAHKAYLKMRDKCDAAHARIKELEQEPQKPRLFFSIEAERDEYKRRLDALYEVAERAGADYRGCCVLLREALDAERKEREDAE